MGIFYNISTDSDDANGIKIIENPTKTLKALLFPREKLHDFNQRPEAQQAGVYILYNSMDRNEQPHIYIGQTGYSITSRLSNHNRTKDFWDQALVFVEKGDFLNLNSAHAKIIESRLISKAGECGAVVMENSDGSRAPRVQPSDQMAADTWAEEVVTITRLLGLAFFHGVKAPVSQPVVSVKPASGFLPDGVYRYKPAKKKSDGRTIYATAVANGTTWTLKAGSRLGVHEDPGLSDAARAARKSFRMDSDGTLLEDAVVEGVKSPSFIGSIVRNASCDGWVHWQTEDGKSIEMFRN